MGRPSEKIDDKPRNVQRPQWLLYLDMTRIHKLPSASVVVMSPFLWGASMGSYRMGMANAREFALTILFWAIGGTIGHSAGCVWNDICDRKIDRRVERTKTRPLATDSVPVLGAVILWICLQGFCITLLMFTNRTALLLGVFDLTVLNTIYPFAKRWTHWPQAILGLAFALGVPISWVAAVGSFDYSIIALLAIAKISWVLHYDTIYGCQDRRDDVKVGVKSTAVLFGDHTRAFCAVCSLLCVTCLAAAGILNSQGWLYFAITVGGAALHLAWQIVHLDSNDPEICGRLFATNGILGLVISAGMAADYVWKWLL